MIAKTAGKLSAKQRRFVDAYLGEAGGNAMNAARIAGFRELRGYPSKLLRMPQVKAAIEEAFAESAISAREVIARLSAIATSDMSDFTRVDKKTGKPTLDLRKAERLGKMHLIKDMTIGPDGSAKIKLESKAEALTLLSKYHGLLVERVEVEHRDSTEDVRASILAKFDKIKESLSDSDRKILEDSINGGNKGIGDGGSGAKIVEITVTDTSNE